MPLHGGCWSTGAGRCVWSAGPARARPRCCSPPWRGGSRLVTTRSARWCWSAAGGRRGSCASGSSTWRTIRSTERTSREPLVRTVHSYAFGVLRLHAARNGDPPPRLLASAEQDAVVRDLLGGELAGPEHGGCPTRAGPSGCARRSACPASPPSCASCCCARPSAGSGRRSSPSWAAATACPSGPPPGGSSAATSTSSCCAGPRAAGRRRPRLPHWTPPSWWLPRSTRSPPTRSCSPPSGSGCGTSSSTTRRTSTRSRWSWSGCWAPRRRPCCSPATPTRPSSTSVEPIRRACGPSRPRRWCSPVDHRSAPAVRAAVARLAARLPGAGAGRERAAPPAEPELPGDGAGAGVRLRRAGGRVDRRPAAPRPPHRRRAVVADGGAGPLHPPLAAHAAPRAAGRGRADRRAARRAAARPPARRRAAAAWCCAAPPGPTSSTPTPRPRCSPRRSARPTRCACDGCAAGCCACTPAPARPGSRTDAERAGSDPLLVAGAAGGGARASRPAGRRCPRRRRPRCAGSARCSRSPATPPATARAPRRCSGGSGRRPGSGTRLERRERARRSGRARRPTATSTPCSRCSTPPRGTPTGCPVPTSPASPSTSPTSSCPAIRSPPRAPQGEAVALLTAHAARGREWDVVAVPARAGGQLARPAAARQPAGQRAAGRPRRRGRRAGRSSGVAGGAAARRGAAAVLRGLHAGPAHAAGQRRAGRGRAALPLPRRARPGAGHQRRPPGPPARPVAGARRAGRRAAPGGVRARPTTRQASSAASRRIAAGPAGRGRRAGRPPRRLVRAGSGVHRRAAARARRGRAGVAVGRREDRPMPAALGAGAPRRRRRWARWRPSPARWCTRWCRPSAAGADGAELEGALRSAWSRLDAGAPWFGRRELERVRGMLAAFDGWVRSSRAEGLRLVAVEQPVQLDLAATSRASWASAPGSVRPVAAPARARRPAGGRRGGPAGGRRREDRQDRGQRPGGGRAPAARRLPARGGARRVRRAARARCAARRRPAGVPGRPEGGRTGEGAGPAAARRRRAGAWEGVVRRCAEETSGARFIARVGPDCDRCPVRTSCPLSESGRPVPDA